MTEPNDIRWTEFIEQALSASFLAEYKYCPSKAILSMEIEEEKTPEMSEGQFIHEQEAQKIIEGLGPIQNVPFPETLEGVMSFSQKQLEMALNRKEILANKEDVTLFLSVVPSLGVWGKPDIADCRDGQHPFIIETKTTHQLPYKAWDNDRLQIGVYMLGLEALGFECKYGLLRYKLRHDPEQVREFRVSLDNELRRFVEDIVYSMRKVLDENIEPGGADTQGKCTSCKAKNPVIYQRCKRKLI